MSEQPIIGVDLASAPDRAALVAMCRCGATADLEGMVRCSCGALNCPDCAAEGCQNLACDRNADREER